MATQIIESLISAEQGVKSVFCQVNLQGCLNQDIADFHSLPKLMRHYLDKFGYKDVNVAGVFGSQSPLFPFPQEMGSAFGYIGYTALTAAMGGCHVVSVKTVDEAAGVPSADSHRQSYLAALWILGCWKDQKFEIDNAAIRKEEEVCQAEVHAILDKVFELGNGDVAVGTVKAVEAGVLDSPMFHQHPRGRQGARHPRQRWRLPLPRLRQPAHPRGYQGIPPAEGRRAREAEGRTMDYYTSIEDFWAISKGRLKGIPEQ